MKLQGIKPMRWPKKKKMKKQWEQNEILFVVVCVRLFLWNFFHRHVLYDSLYFFFDLFLFIVSLYILWCDLNPVANRIEIQIDKKKTTVENIMLGVQDSNYHQTCVRYTIWTCSMMMS